VDAAGNHALARNALEIIVLTPDDEVAKKSKMKYVVTIILSVHFAEYCDFFATIRIGATETKFSLRMGDFSPIIIMKVVCCAIEWHAGTFQPNLSGCGR
jgi:hypothetical protein